MSKGRHWLVWDGECGVCSTAAGVMRRRDVGRQFQICSYQNCPRPPMTDEAYKIASRSMLVFTEDGKTLAGAKAFLFIYEHTGWGKFARFLGYPPIIWLLHIGYWIFAKSRGPVSRVFLRNHQCGLDNRYPEIDSID